MMTRKNCGTGAENTPKRPDLEPQLVGFPARHGRPTPFLGLLFSAITAFGSPQPSVGQAEVGHSEISLAEQARGLAAAAFSLQTPPLASSLAQPFDGRRHLQALIEAELLTPPKSLSASSVEIETLPREKAARIHLALGHRARELGQAAMAIEHYRLSIRLDAEMGEAHLALGTLLGQDGRLRQSARAFGWLIDLDPDDPRAYLGRALALERLGHHHLARVTLENGSQRLSNNAEILHRLARLLAASPDASVRDGQKAIALAQQALQLGRQAPYAETLAMAMAETGLFAEARALATAVLEQARTSGAESDLVERLGRQIELYRSGQPFRLPAPTP